MVERQLPKLIVRVRFPSPAPNRAAQSSATAAAFSYDRKTEASLLSHAADLDQLLSQRYPDERLADDFHERYRDAQDDLRQKAHSDT
jgi:hypothetical protein